MMTGPVQLRRRLRTLITLPFYRFSAILQGPGRSEFGVERWHLAVARCQSRMQGMCRAGVGW